MSQLRDPAKDALLMLGETGELRRIPALALVYPSQAGWVVRAGAGGSDFEIAGFLGPHARERAIEYAGEKYSGMRILDSQL